MDSLKYGPHKIIKYLGGGTTGDVFVAVDEQLDDKVALKVLKEKHTKDEEIFRRFLDEPKVLRRVAHPNIVTVYGVGFDQAPVYIAMELLKGKSLDKIIAENRLAPKQIVDIGIQMATALNYAHQKGIFHRDVKPANIISTSDDASNRQFKLTDFGIAHIQNLKRTTVGTVLGSPFYMSPEQARALPVDGRSDLYSLGAVLYECATGKPPFQAKTWDELRPKIINESPATPLKDGKPLPPGLSKVILKCLEKNPNKRFQTGNEMKEALKKCLPEISDGTSRKNALKKIAIIFGIIILVPVIAYIPDRCTPPPMTELKIRSTPPEAHVFIGNDFKGFTPLKIKLPSKKFNFKITLDGYWDWEATIRLVKKDETLNVKLEPKEKKEP